MKLLIAAPNTGAVKTTEIEDDILRKANLSDYRMGQEIDGHIFGEAFKGYRFRISGGQDKEGFPMKQGVMTAARVRLLLVPGTLGFQKWRARSGERKRRSVRGCILGNDLASISLVVVRKGEKDIEGVTNVSHPRRLGPKRANKIRKLFGITGQNVTKYVVRRKIEEKDRSDKNLPNRKAYTKAPRIQRLIVPSIIRRRLNKLKEKKERLQESAQERKSYISLLLANRRDQRLRRESNAARKNIRDKKKQEAEIREARRKSFEKSKKTQPKATKAAEKPKEKTAPKKK